MPRHPTRSSVGRPSAPRPSGPSSSVPRSSGLRSSGPGPSVPRPAGPRAVALAALLDAASILAFAAAGRSSHDRDGGLAGVLGTAWPFLAAATAGWVLARTWRAPGRVWPTGVVVWAVAWVGGLGLRAAAGDGTAPAFVVVAGLVLGALLVGRRVLTTALSPAVRRRRPARPAPGR